MNLENYWQARPGSTKLRKLEQFFSQIVARNPDFFEVIAIYTSLRNDQYRNLREFLSRWGPETSWFIKECKVDHTRLGREILSKNLKPPNAKFKIK